MIMEKNTSKGSKPVDTRSPKTSTTRKLSRSTRDWLDNFVEEEVRQGTPKKEAERAGKEVVDNLVDQLYAVQ